jgi:hypothetical protein
MSGCGRGGEVHGFANENAEVGRVVAVVTPGGAGGLFGDTGQPARDRSLPEPPEPTDETFQSVFATGEAHGFEFVGPVPERTARPPAPGRRSRFAEPAPSEEPACQPRASPRTEATPG